MPGLPGGRWRKTDRDLGGDVPSRPCPAGADRRLVEEEAESTVALPLRARGQVLGVLVLGGGANRVFGEAEIELLTVFGAQAALILQNAHLFAKSERRRRVAERLAEIANLLPQSLAVEEVGQRIADAVFAVLDVRVASVFGLDQGHGGSRAWSRSRVIRGPACGPGSCFLTRPGWSVSRSGSASRADAEHPDGPSGPRSHRSSRAAIEQAQYHAVLAVPLSCKTG